MTMTIVIVTMTLTLTIVTVIVMYVTVVTAMTVTTIIETVASEESSPACPVTYRSVVIVTPFRTKENLPW